MPTGASATPRIGAMPELTRAHVFVERDGLIVVLQQAGSSRWWECPGGDVEASEEPVAAAVREVFEETGLRIDAPDLLRRWEYENRHGTLVTAYAFAARADGGDVRLGIEHSDYAWLSASDYAARYCPLMPETAPGWTSLFLAGMRENCRLFELWLQRSAAPCT